MRAPRSVLALAASAAIVATACDALLSIHVLDDHSDAAPAACAACTATKCAAASSACVTDPAVCAPYETCLGACEGGVACRSQCTIDHPVLGAGSQAVSALSACLASNCATECGLSCGSFAAYLSEPASAASCQSCLGLNACSHAGACASSEDCDAYWRCYMACRTPDCKFSCAAQHEAGAALFRPLQGDYAGSCSTECAFGNYWACVGKFSWPSTTVTQLYFTIPVVDILEPHAGIPGETVTVCSGCPCDTAATTVLGQATTDDAGVAIVHVIQTSTKGGQGLTGCTQVTSPSDATVPFYGYWGYPLTEPVVDPRQGPGTYDMNIAAQSVQVFTPAELEAGTGLLGTGLLPGRGFVGAAVFDCLANPTPGAQVKIDTTDPLVTTFYGSGGMATDSLGLGSLLNVAPGMYTVSALPGPLDGGASSVQTSIRVDQGTTTAVGMFPTPMP